jgi:hypothetical protein
MTVGQISVDLENYRSSMKKKKQGDPGKTWKIGATRIGGKGRSRSHSHVKNVDNKSG